MKWIFSVARAFATMPVILGALFLVSCGGGGGSSNDGGTSQPQVGTVNSTTAPQLTSVPGTVMTGSSLVMSAITLNTGSGIYSPKTLLRHGEDLIFGKKTSRLAGSESSTEPCTVGGTETINSTWDGPDSPTDCSEVKNLKIQFVFNSCQENAETLNGTMTLDVPGDSCTDAPAAFNISLENLRHQNPGQNTDVTFNITMNFSNIQYDANDNIAGAAVLVNGTVSGTEDGTTANVTYENWSQVLSDVEWDASNNISAIKATMSGRWYGTVNQDQFDENCDNLVLNTWNSMQGSVFGTTNYFYGEYKGACLDGWVTFTTLEGVFIPESGDCPTSGQIKVSGNGEATATFHSDGSITVNVEGKALQYPTCDDLPVCVSG